MLRQLQESFQAHLLTADTKISEKITGSSQEMVEERLEIYSEGYRWRLLEALEIDYAIVKSLVGEKEFENLGFAYLDNYPSRYYLIDLVGQHLSHFLANAKPWSEKPYLSEFANFAWALNRSITTADAPILTADDLIAIPQDNWPELRLVLHPSVELLTFNWNVTAVWQALNAKQKLPVWQQEINYVAVWRKEIQSYFAVLSTKDKWVLQALQQGLSFGEVCEGLLEWLAEDKVGEYAVGLLVNWLQDGLISEVNY